MAALKHQYSVGTVLAWTGMGRDYVQVLVITELLPATDVYNVRHAFLARGAKQFYTTSRIQEREISRPGWKVLWQP